MARRKKSSAEEQTETTKPFFSSSEANIGVQSNGAATLVLADGDYSGRDEMNLAGNPFALLQAAAKNSQTVIRNEWERRLPNGKIVMASWEVRGHPELGLAGPTEEMLFLVLLQLTREAAEIEGGPWPQTVSFSRRDVLRRMGWTDTKRYYELLADAFTRLRGIGINARYAFYDPVSKLPFAMKDFSLVDEVQIVDEKAGKKTQGSIPLSSFKWSDVMHSSFVNGNVRNLALDFLISLESPTARRLFRMLELFRHSSAPPRNEFSIGVMKLRDRLGMSPYKYTSKVKEKLAGAHDELVGRGFLKDVSYTKNRDGVETVTYHFAKAQIFEENATSGASASHAIAQTAFLAPQNPSAPPRSEKPRKAVKIAEKGLKTALKKGAVPENLHDDRNPAEKYAPAGLCAQERAVHWRGVFDGLEDATRTALLERAKAHVNPAFWDRLTLPESPIAAELWEIVARFVHEKSE